MHQYIFHIDFYAGLFLKGCIAIAIAIATARQKTRTEPAQEANHKFKKKEKYLPTKYTENVCQSPTYTNIIA
jgi:hypothetical protein